MTDKKIAFLVDFDNVATDVIEQALQMCFKDYGTAHIRRAYCNAEQAHHQQAFMKRLGLRAIVNLAIGKNSTDIALAADAMDIAINERPDVIVLVSSDSDFAPLVLRLREKGAWLRGFGQYGKTGDGVIQIYDQFNELAHGTGRSAREAAPAKAAGGRGGRRGGRGGGRGPAEAPRGNLPARPPRHEPVVTALPEPVAPEAVEPAIEMVPVAEAPAVVPVVEPRATPEPAPAAKAPRAAKPAGKAARKTAAKAPAGAPADVLPAPVAQAEILPDAKPAKPAPKAAPKPKAEPKVESKPAAAAPAADPQVAAAKEINAILALLPKLADGQWHELGAAAKVLKDAGLLARNAPSTKLFRKHPNAFELQPDKNPNRVRFGHG